MNLQAFMAWSLAGAVVASAAGAVAARAVLPRIPPLAAAAQPATQAHPLIAAQLPAAADPAPAHALPALRPPPPPAPGPASEAVPPVTPQPHVAAKRAPASRTASKAQASRTPRAAPAGYSASKLAPAAPWPLPPPRRVAQYPDYGPYAGPYPPVPYPPGPYASGYAVYPRYRLAPGY